MNLLLSVNNQTPFANCERRLGQSLTATCRLTRSLPLPVLTSTSVPNPHAEAAAVIAVIVIVDGEYQTTIGGDGSV
jgi:hypothetical protein